MKLVSMDGKSNSQNKSLGPQPQKLTEECRGLLLDKKVELLELINSMKLEHQHRDKAGDEVDLSLDILAEDRFYASLERLQGQLLEVEFALARIENGSFGVCEETEEYIEEDRLRAIPWTRLSIEGAELREALQKRFVR